LPLDQLAKSLANGATVVMTLKKETLYSGAQSGVENFKMVISVHVASLDANEELVILDKSAIGGDVDASPPDPP
jgi:hypothetical protein